MTNFHVGQKVAATDDLDCEVNKGDIFTISSIETGRFIAYDGVKQLVSLYFYEKQPRTGCGGFDARFFRPVVARKTDISIFKAMLTPSKEEVRA